MRERRRQAVALFERGETQATVARRLRVSRMSAKRWFDAWRAGGKAAMHGAGRAGRPPKVLPEQLERISAELLKGPQAHGYATQVWTLARVRDVIAELTGVRYHEGHVWRVLRALGWSIQKPTTRARERDEEAIRRWVRVKWPALQKTLAGDAPRASSSTKAASRSGRRSGAPGRHEAARRS